MNGIPPESKTLVKQRIYGKIDLELSVYDNLTFVLGDSGTGKTFVFSTLYAIEKADRNSKFRFFSIYDSDNISSIKEMHNKIILIDNADIILDVEIKEFIRQDRNNYYIIFGKDHGHLDTGPFNLARLNHSNNKITLDFLFLKHVLF